MPRIYIVDDIRTLVRNARRDARYTQARLADLSGVTRKWLSDFERGRNDPPLSLALKLLITLGVAVTLTTRPAAAADLDAGFDDSGEGL
jgi:transcriptional regulator with XRE-family HTH domain